ncbi:MAG TPA: ATP-binding protein [Longimicrobiales bacterium]
MTDTNLRRVPVPAPAGGAVGGGPGVSPPADLVLDAIRDHAIFTLDSTGTITSWNEGARRLTGYSDTEALGASYSMFSTQDSAGEVARMLQTARDTGVFNQERWWRRRDAGVAWVEEVIQPYEEIGFIVVTRDLTERMAAEERRFGLRHDSEGVNRERLLRAELQVAERRAAFLAEASSILVATSLDFDSTVKALARLAVSRLADWCVIHSIDEDGTFTRAEIAHRDPELESRVERIVDEALNERWRTTVRSVVRTGQSAITALEPSTRLDAESMEEDVASLGHGCAMVTPLIGRGSVTGAITFVRMDTEHPYDEDELALAEELGRRAAIALDNARLYRQAQEANRAKADFLAIVSHELRTPLNAIMGYTDLLDAGISGELTDKQRRQLDRIRTSARHLLQLIEEILSFARIEAGGEELRVGPIAASAVADEAAAAMEPLARSKGLEFEVDIEEDVKLETDADKLRQILVNLLSNAVKFTERGGVKLRFRHDDTHAWFDVIDTGIGIPREQIGRIFDPFWQIERPNTRRAGGTGLGLSVARRFVRLLHGEINLHSEPGSGTTFSVKIPRRHGRPQR